jgi:membrane-bound ClpP family serine protease
VWYQYCTQIVIQKVENKTGKEIVQSRCSRTLTNPKTTLIFWTLGVLFILFGVDGKCELRRLEEHQYL